MGGYVLMATWKVMQANGTWLTISETSVVKVLNDSGVWVTPSALEVNDAKSIDPVDFTHRQVVNVSPPSEVPGTPTLVADHNYEVDASWSNTNTTDEIVLLYEDTDTGTYTQEVVLSAGTTQHTYSVGVGGVNIRARAAYQNAAGTGTYSDWSDTVTTRP